MDRRRDLPDPRRLLPHRYIPEQLGSKTRLHVLAILVTLVADTVLFAWAENHGVVESLYFIVMAMTLIGANYIPVTLAGKAIAIDRGLVKGVTDRTADEFVLAQAEARQVFLEKCPHCGGDVKRWAFPEERFSCPYCNMAVSVPAALRRQRSERAPSAPLNRS